MSLPLILPGYLFIANCPAAYSIPEYAAMNNYTGTLGHMNCDFQAAVAFGVRK